MPEISVIMPAYNSEKYIGEAIDSILNQTFTDFEFIIIDDGSTDSTAEIIRSYKDERIKYLKNEKNSGIVVTLNKGIEAASGRYIARMDSDDISLPERFYKQAEYMEKHPEVSVLATNVKLIGEGGKAWPTSPCHEQLKVDMLFSCCLCHPTVMMRKKLFDDNNLLYDNEYKGLEDYELWYRVSGISKLACLEEELFCYRVHPSQVSREINPRVKSQLRKLKYRILSNLDIDENDKGAEVFIDYCNEGLLYDKKALREFCEKLIAQNRKTGYYDEELLKGSLRGIILKTFDNSNEKRRYLLSHKMFEFTPREQLRLVREFLR